MKPLKIRRNPNLTKRINLKSHLRWAGVLVLVLASLLATTSMAEDKGAPPPEEHGAPKAEGKGEAKEGGPEAKKEGAGEFVKKDEFLELNAAIEQLTAKVRSKNESLNKLLEEKNHIKDPVQFKELVQELEKEYLELKELIDTLDKKKDVLRYRFPEKSFVKKADKTKLQPLEEMGSELVVEKKLNELLKRVEKQYQGTIRSKESLDKEEREPASEHPQHEGKHKTEQTPEEFTHSLILKK
jgi:hypothetical protein